MAERLPLKIDFSDIQEAQVHLQSFIRETPMHPSTQIKEWLGTPATLYLKYENRQRTGSFKLRGALNKMAHLTEVQREKGVVASSAGNHAQGVAYGARCKGVRAHVVMPQNAPLVKVAATKGYGAEVILHGQIYDEAQTHALNLAKENDWVFVPPYEDPYIIAGQGTLGLEIGEALDSLNCVVAAVGGGGMISGVATAIKKMHPKCRIIGVQNESAPAMYESFHQKQMIEHEPRPSCLADGVAVKRPSQNMYNTYLSPLLDDMVLVSEEEVAHAITFLMERTKTVVEGSGALPVAAVLSGKIPLKAEENVALILSGGNIDLNIVANVIQQGLKKSGRYTQLCVLVPDTPGTLKKLTDILSLHRANILEVMHDRLAEDLFLREAKIRFFLETSSQQQIQAIHADIQRLGWKIT